MGIEAYTHLKITERKGIAVPISLRSLKRSLMWFFSVWNATSPFPKSLIRLNNGLYLVYNAKSYRPLCVHEIVKGGRLVNLLCGFPCMP